MFIEDLTQRVELILNNIMSTHRLHYQYPVDNTYNINTCHAIIIASRRQSKILVSNCIFGEQLMNAPGALLDPKALVGNHCTIQTLPPLAT